MIAAIAMVGGAVVVRAQLDERGEERTQGVRITCVSELDAVCTALDNSDDLNAEVTIEPAGVTAARLSTATTPDIGLDAWVAPAPWPAIVSEARQRAGLPAVLGPPSRVIARSPLVLVIWRDRGQVLEGRCPAGLGWRCAGDASGAPSWAAIGGSEQWGIVKPLHSDPRTEAGGLAVLGAGTVEYFGRADLSAIDLDDDSYLAWVSGWARALPNLLPSATGSVQKLLAEGPAAVDFVATTEAEAGPEVARSARGSDVRLIYPSPVTSVDIVVTPGTDDRSQRAMSVVTNRLPAALARSGWRVTGEDLASGVGPGPALPAGSGMPSPGVLEALRSRFDEFAG